MHAEVIHNALIRENLKVLSEAIKALDLSPEHKAAVEFFCDLKTGALFYTPSTIPSHEIALLIITLDIDNKSVTWRTREKEKLDAQAESHLHEMALILKQSFSRIDKLGHLIQLQWESPCDHQPADSLLKQTWHEIDRETAEKILLKQSLGTFLFRKDSFALTLQEILRRGLKTSVLCYTLSYLDQEGIVRDKTVILVHQKWMVYDDDPTLSGPRWRSVNELIQSLGLNAQYPLFSQHRTEG